MYFSKSRILQMPYYFLSALKKFTSRLTQEKPGFPDCAVSQLYVFFFLFRDRVVRAIPKNKAQLQFLVSLEDKADVSMTSIFEHI